MEGVMQETITAEERTELEKERFALAIERTDTGRRRRRYLPGLFCENGGICAVFKKDMGF